MIEAFMVTKLIDGLSFTDDRDRLVIVRPKEFNLIVPVYWSYGAAVEAAGIDRFKIETIYIPVGPDNLDLGGLYR